jgi:hypothetical protein
MFPLQLNPAQPEITDLVVSHDPATLERLPVNKNFALHTFATFRNHQAAVILIFGSMDPGSDLAQDLALTERFGGLYDSFPFPVGHIGFLAERARSTR